jgi:hypothetical protein
LHKPDKKLTAEVLDMIGLNYTHGFVIHLQKMVHIAFPVFYLVMDFQVRQVS